MKHLRRREARGRGHGALPAARVFLDFLIIGLATKKTCATRSLARTMSRLSLSPLAGQRRLGPVGGELRDGALSLGSWGSVFATARRFCWLHRSHLSPLAGERS